MPDRVVTIPLPGQPLSEAPAPGQSGRATALGDFFAGPENRLIEPAVREILGLSDPACDGTFYNPLVLYGASGTGKSHIARGLARAWKARFPRRPVVFVVAVDFARELNDAIESQAVDDLRVRYRAASLLVIEDLGGLAGRLAAQEELTHTLDAVLRHGGQVVVTARVAPVAMTDLLPPLQSRLTAGLAVPLAAPGREARIHILRQLASLREIDLDDRVLQLLAEGLAGTVPELHGALVQLDVPARHRDRKIDVAAAQKYLARHTGPPMPTIPEIAGATARYFALKTMDLRGPCRRRPVVTARDVAMYLARTLAKQSYQRIGQYFGHRDHTTVMHSCRKVAGLARADAAVDHAVDQLRQKLAK